MFTENKDLMGNTEQEEMQIALEEHIMRVCELVRQRMIRGIQNKTKEDNQKDSYSDSNSPVSSL